MAKRKQPRPGASEAEKQTPSAAPSVQQAAPRAHQPAKQAHLPAAGAPQLGPWQLSDDQRQRLQSALNSAQSHFTVTHSKASKGSSKRARTSGVKGQPRSDLHADRLGDVCRRLAEEVLCDVNKPSSTDSETLESFTDSLLAQISESVTQETDSEGDSVTWDVFERCAKEAYTRHCRQQHQSQLLAQAQRLLAAGTAVTNSQRSEALQLLRMCIAADRRAAGGSDGTQQQAPAPHKCVSQHSLQARLLLGRQLHAYALTSNDLQEAQSLLVRLLALTDELLSTDDSNGSDTDDTSSDSHDTNSTSNGLQLDTALSETARSCRTAAQSLLALLLCQGGRDAAAAQLLSTMGGEEAGYRYRLAPGVLHYKLPARPDTQPHPAADTHTAAAPSTHTQHLPSTLHPSPAPYVHAYDNALPVPLLSALQRAFAPGSAIWSDHRYRPDGSTPYFSYVHPTTDSVTTHGASVTDKGLSGSHESETVTAPVTHTLMDQLIHKVIERVSPAFPAVAKARYAEWWAHCRPHSNGHQVLYLTEGVGGPTLVTPQAFNTPQLPTHGWLVHPRLNRLTVFRGDVLHGVIPGRASVEQPPATASSINGGDSSPPFRVTVMVALWEDIRVRRHPPGQFGAAMAWPVVTDTPTNPGPSTLTAANRAVTTANTGSQEQGEGKDKSHHSTAAERTSKPPSKRTRVQGQQGTSTQQTTGLEPTLTWPSLFSALPDTGTHAGALTGTGVASPLTLHGSVSVCEVTPEPVAPVWCDVCEGESRAAGCSVGQMVAQGRLPSYDACFQGF